MSREELRKAILTTLALAVGAIVIAEVAWGAFALFISPAL